MRSHSHRPARQLGMPPLHPRATQSHTSTPKPRRRTQLLPLRLIPHHQLPQRVIDIDTIWVVHESITDAWIARAKDRDSQEPTQPPPAPPAPPKATGAPALPTTEAVTARVLQTPSDKPPPRQRGDSHAGATHDWAATFPSPRNALTEHSSRQHTSTTNLLENVPQPKTQRRMKRTQRQPKRKYHQQPFSPFQHPAKQEPYRPRAWIDLDISSECAPPTTRSTRD